MKRRPSAAIWTVGIVAFIASVVLVARSVDLEALGRVWREAVRSPAAIALVLLAYGSAFLLRAAVWCRVLPGLPIGQALAALHVSLAGNHVLPLRLGEALRVTSVVRRAGVSAAAATASTVMLRAADVVAVVTLAAALSPGLVDDLVGGAAGVVAIGGGGLWIAGVLWLVRLRGKKGIEMNASPALVALAAVAAWAIESVVIWQAAAWSGISLEPHQAILATAVTIAAQTVAIAPGGLGTYEAAATAALVALGADVGAALAAAIAAHALKTAYALATGAVALFVPSPTAFGRIRLEREARTAMPPPPLPEGPLLLFLPAHNEERAVAGVVARVPRVVCGRTVECVVIDDGSTDATPERAGWAGADVVRLEQNRGLGAAVRRGLEEAIRRNAVAVAFCDADGEYAPEELERLVQPILAGDADYVVGSRFAGRIRRMLPHRRVGNRILTWLLAFVARRRITDGQSGYRAFSAAAAADADVIHDFNYAQVLTLDLLAKGYRYAEVPISYSFRETGSSFVRLGRYLRHVIPAVHRELNPPRELVLDDVRGESLTSSSPSR